MYNEDQWKTYCEMYEELETFAYTYIKEFGAEREEVSSVSADGGIISINTDEYWNYGGHDTNTHNVPMECLWDENWVEKEKARLNTIRINEEKARHQKLIADNNKKLAAEKELYTTLKKKYGE